VETVRYSSKNPSDDPSLSANEIPELATFDPKNLLEAVLENQDDGVKITIYYNKVALKTLVDDSNERITEGVGVGLKFKNNGVNLLIGGKFTDLKVVQAE
jgi:hypothetical protein